MSTQHCEDILNDAETIVNGFRGLSNFNRKLRSHFGVSEDVLNTLWTLVHPLQPPAGKAKYLLWALYYLKVYPTDVVGSSTCQVDKKTYTKWINVYFSLMAGLNLVSDCYS
jgi:hypothetical protein